MQCKLSQLTAILFLAALVSIPVASGFQAKDQPKQDADNFQIVGQIVPNDLPDKMRRHPCKIHSLKLSKDKTYVIELESKDFDTFLRIEDSTGKQLAFDDDGGEGLNSRLRFAPPKEDVFRVIATSFGGGAGTYTLKVRVEDNAKPK